MSREKGNRGTQVEVLGDVMPGCFLQRSGYRYNKYLLRRFQAQTFFFFLREIAEELNPLPYEYCCFLYWRA